jgi:hypothetical protein
MLIKISAVLSLLISISMFSCGENDIAGTSQPELLLSAEGIVEHLGGDCSAVQVRTRSLGTTDLNPYSKIKLEIDGMSDADLSSVQVFYWADGEQRYMLDLQNREEINSTNSIELTSPDFSGEIYTRVTLKSSVCTGQIYFLTLRDVKLYGIR